MPEKREKADLPIWRRILASRGLQLAGGLGWPDLASKSERVSFVFSGVGLI